jgi:hypothetical protein
VTHENEGGSNKPKGAAQITTRQCAYFIVDGLITEHLINAADLERAVNVVVDELNVRRAIGDYSFDDDRE